MPREKFAGMTSGIENIGKKIFTGTLWTVGSRMSIRFLGIISMIILARLLDPEDFGLVAKAVMIQSFLIMVTEMGLEAALIKDRNAGRGHYDTVWTVHIIRGGILGIILAMLAYPASIYLHESRLENIIYCYATVTFVGGFYNIGIVDFRKNMTFSFDFQYNLYKKIAGFVTTITVALIWETYWALVAGVIASQLVTLVTSFLMSPYRPKISLIEWKSLFHFSKWMLGYELLGAISMKLDAFLLSRYSTTANMGLYTISYEVSGMPSTEIAMPVARAAMPGLSLVNHNIKEFSEMYLSLMGIVLLISIPAASGVSILADHITLAILGEKWLGAVPLIEILVFFGITRGVYATAVSALIAYDRADMLAKMTLFGLFSRILFLSIGINYYGLIGMVWGVLFASIFNASILIIIQDRLGILPIKKLLYYTWKIIISALIMYFGLYYIRQFPSPLHEQIVLIQLLAEIIIGAFLYSASLISLWLIFSRSKGPEMEVLKFFLKRKGQNT